MCLTRTFYPSTIFSGGWVFKPEKSSGPPSQSVKYLGIVINLVNAIWTRLLVTKIPFFGVIKLGILLGFIFPTLPTIFTTRFPPLVSKKD